MSSTAIARADAFSLRPFAVTIAGILALVFADVGFGVVTKMGVVICAALVFLAFLMRNLLALRFRRLGSVLLAMFAFAAAFVVILGHEEGLHFAIMRPVYAMEIARLRPGADGVRSKNWNGDGGLGYDVSLQFYDGKDRHLPTDEDDGCKVTRRPLAENYTLTTMYCR